MPYSSGTFTLYSPGNPVVTGTTISSTWGNNTLSDVATGLSTCVLKNGTQTITANLPMAGFKFTGLGAGSAIGDSVRYEQVLLLTGGTMVGDLLFTDATYDIGKTGATRPRDFFLSRNAVIGGHVTLEGVTSTGATGTALVVFSASPTLSGTPLSTTAAADTNTTQIATTAFVIGQAATQAQQEAASSTTTHVSPGRQQYHPSAAKAWVLFNGTGVVAITLSYNVTSITDNGTGDYTVNFTTAFSTANYAFSGEAFSPSSANGVLIGNSATAPTASALRVLSTNTSFAATDQTHISVSCFGDQA